MYFVHPAAGLQTEARKQSLSAKNRYFSDLETMSWLDFGGLSAYTNAVSQHKHACVCLLLNVVF